MEIDNERLNEVTVVTVDGRFDATGAPEMESHCKQLLAEGSKRWVLDLGNLVYISSAGLRSLLVLAKTLKAAGGAMVLCQLTPMVREVMDISGFDKIFTIVLDRDSALAALNPVS